MTESMEKGSILENGKIVIDSEKMKNDFNKSHEDTTMTVIKQFVESVDNMIKFSFDSPSMNENGRLAILDVEVNINKAENNRLDFQFYEKPTKNSKLMLYDAAIPSSQKRTILTQEGLRRLRNTKAELGQNVQKMHLDKYMLKLKNSGYPCKYRTQILDSILKAHKKMLEDDMDGIKPLYRNREWNRDERIKKKAENKLNWYKNPKNSEINYTSVLLVPVTKNGELVKEVKKREQEINKYSDERIKIVEEGGTKVKDMLVKKNPFPNKNCEVKKCLMCTSEIPDKPNIPCNSENVGYKLVCETCKSRGVTKVYDGETSRSARIRGAEHLRNFKNEREDSAMYKHKMSEHPNEAMNFSMQILKKFRDPLSRQANEGVRISNRDRKTALNSKNEFNHPPIARISVERSKNNFIKKNIQAQPSLLNN